MIVRYNIIIVIKHAPIVLYNACNSDTGLTLVYFMMIFSVCGLVWVNILSSGLFLLRRRMRGVSDLTSLSDQIFSICFALGCPLGRSSSVYYYSVYGISHASFIYDRFYISKEKKLKKMYTQYSRILLLIIGSAVVPII